MSYLVLSDSQVSELITMGDMIPIIEDALNEKAKGLVLSPPRFGMDVPNGTLLVSGGGSADTGHGVVGVRLYGNFKSRWPERDDVIVAYNSSNGTLKGIVIGNTLADMRTGAIGGVAIKFLSNPNSKKLGIIGTGAQARTQLEAAVCVRDFEKISVYSRKPENRKRFVEEMSERINHNIVEVDSGEMAVKDADVVICATVSNEPVVRRTWLKENGVHINSIGPKFEGAHELDSDILPACKVIVTDSIAQSNAYPKPFFLNGTIYKDKMIELHTVVSGKEEGRTAQRDNTLFISTGLTGTEIIAAGRILEKAAGRTPS